MTDAELGAIQARLNAVGEIEIERDGRFLFELTGVEGDEPENRWWAGIQTQHGHMPEQDMCELATLFQHAPIDIRALLEEVRRGKAVEGLARRMRDAFVHVAEYWNGSKSEGAMSDALDEIDATANAMLADADKLLGEG